MARLSSVTAMRIWDLPVGCLCRNHLLAEHRELHAVWNVILKEKRGYSRHPEVMRWRGCVVALWERHEQQVREFTRRGYSHKSPLDLNSVPRKHRGSVQKTRLETLNEQRRKLRRKGCSCEVNAGGRRAGSLPVPLDHAHEQHRGYERPPVE